MNQTSREDTNNKDSHMNNSDDPPKQEINLQFHWYFLSFFLIFLGSFLIPGILLTLYIIYFYYPYLLSTNAFILIFIKPRPLLASVFLPLVIMGCYVLHLLMVGVITRGLWGITEKNSPSKEGIIPRNIQSKTLNYYHIRSFMIKYPKNAFIKGPFPWLLNWFYNFVGTNKIGKGTTIEEQFGADKFVEMGEDCYIGVNSGFSSHSLEGIFGNLSYFKIKLGDNVTTGGINCVAPGAEIKDNSYLFPLASATKHSKLRGDNYYFGLPLRRTTNRKTKKYLDVTKEELNKADVLKSEKKEQHKSPSKIDKGVENG
ncbi:MAG: hypothetical protein R6U96_17370 [Promethearchaeia archaeon]